MEENTFIIARDLLRRYCDETMKNEDAVRDGIAFRHNKESYLMVSLNELTQDEKDVLGNAQETAMKALDAYNDFVQNGMKYIDYANKDQSSVHSNDVVNMKRFPHKTYR